MAKLKAASVEQLKQFFREHGTITVLHLANEMLAKEGLTASKSRYYYVKKRYELERLTERARAPQASEEVRRQAEKYAKRFRRKYVRSK